LFEYTKKWRSFHRAIGFWHQLTNKKRNAVGAEAYFVKRFLVALVMLFFLIQLPTVEAAPSLEQSSVKTGADNQAQVLWKLKGAGKPSTDLQFVPNGNILLPQAGQLTAVDTQGAIKWSVKIGGSSGYPVGAANGSIFVPGPSSIQEIKPNGVAGWSFSVYPATSGSSNAWLAYGQNNLYFPQASGLYTLDSTGRLVALTHWNSSELRSTKPPSPFASMACLAAGSDCYAIESAGTDQFQLSVFDAQGKSLWNYWLGALKQAFLLTGADGTVFIAAENKKAAQYNKGRVCSFAPNSTQPQWQTIISDNNFLGLARSAAGSLYLTMKGEMYALDAKTGALLWKSPYDKLASPPATDNKTGRVYAGCSDGRLIAVGPTGRMDWDLSLDGAISRTPLIDAEGFLYVATDNGNLYKIKIPAE